MKFPPLLALVPLALGPLPRDARAITVGLCNGGKITIPLEGDPERPGRECPPQACHAATCREKQRYTA